jgi:hypothetical protein
MTRRAAFRQVDVKRLVKGALAAGLPVGSFKIVVDNGRPTLLPIGAPEPLPADDIDAEIAEFERTHGYG